MNKASNIRYEWLDALKGFGILLVVLGHTQFPYKTFIYWFHMPLFFILSGWTLNYSQEFSLFLKKKLNSLIIPFLTFSTVFILLSFIGHFRIMLVEWLKLIIFGGVRSGGVLGTFWFLPTLFLAEIAIYWILKLRPVYQWSLLAVSFVSVFFLRDIFQLPFNLNIVPLVILYLYFGSLLRDNVFGSMGYNLLIKTILLIFVLCIGYVTGFNLDLKYNVISDVILAVLLPSFVVFVLVFIFQKKWRNNSNTLLSYIGRNSLAIMLIHNFFRIPLESINGLNWIVVFMITILLSLVCVFALQLKVIRKIFLPNIF